MSTVLQNRDSYFDNAKFILIFLVVFGHLIEPVKDQSDTVYTMYNFIYTFHMPAFILISGFFTKGFFKKGYLTKILKKVLIPYFIFQIVYSFYYYNLYDKSDLSLSLFQPNWSLWFLLGLACWNLLLPLFLKLEYPLIWGLIIGVAVGYIPEMGTYLSLSRTFVFSPVFLTGYYLQKQDFRKLFETRIRILAGAFLILVLLAYQFVLPDGTREWLLASSSYADIMGDNAWYSGLIRMFIYATVFVTTFCVLSLIPRRRMFFTGMGAYTLYIYLLHGFVIKFFFTTSLFEMIEASHAYGFLLLAAFLLTPFLASRPVTKVTRPFIELKGELFNWMYEKQKMFSK